MTNNYNPRTLVERYLEEVSGLRPLLYRYINILENIETNTSYFVQRALRHEERLEERERRNARNRFRNRNSPIETNRYRNRDRRPEIPNLNTNISRRESPDQAAENFARIINNLRNLNRRSSNQPVPIPRPRANATTDLSFNFDFLEPVPVLPSQAQIRNATETIHFGNLGSGHNQTCPITQQPFHENERILQIIPCGHCFNRRALLRWFGQSVRCPVCRYDIREYNPSQTIRNPYRRSENTATSSATSASAQPSREEQSLIENIQRSISNTILREMPGLSGQDISGNVRTNTFLRDGSGNLLAMSRPTITEFTFEFPPTSGPATFPNLPGSIPPVRPPPPPPDTPPANGNPSPSAEPSSNEDNNESSESDNATLI